MFCTLFLCSYLCETKLFTPHILNQSHWLMLRYYRVAVLSEKISVEFVHESDHQISSIFLTKAHRK